MDHNVKCVECYPTHCNGCNVGLKKNFSDCTDCAASKVMLEKYDDTNKTGFSYCVDNCPTYFTADANKICKVNDSTKAKIISYNFNVPLDSYKN